jgi:isocitrate/isopropylmalate dehydrogenase
VNADAFITRQPRGVRVVPVVVVLSFVGDLLAVPAGWPGAVASASLAPYLVVFEPVHGSAPTRATEFPLQDNLLGAVRALGLLLEHVGQADAAAWVQVACDTLALYTPD